MGGAHAGGVHMGGAQTGGFHVGGAQAGGAQPGAADGCALNECWTCLRTWSFPSSLGPNGDSRGSSPFRSKPRGAQLGKAEKEAEMLPPRRLRKESKRVRRGEHGGAKAVAKKESTAHAPAHPMPWQSRAPVRIARLPRDGAS